MARVSVIGDGEYVNFVLTQREFTALVRMIFRPREIGEGANAAAATRVLGALLGAMEELVPDEE